MKNVVIFDLDGTLADHEHRVHLVTGKNKDYRTFYQECVNDLPIDDVIDMCNILFKRHRIIILTGRSDEVREETIQWLAKHEVMYHQLYMRPEGNHTLDTVWKKQMAEGQGFTKENVLCVFEDRKRVVDMWRAMGITCYQVADGNF